MRALHYDSHHCKYNDNDNDNDNDNNTTTTTTVHCVLT